MTAPAYVHMTAGAATTGQASITATVPNGSGKIWMVCYSNNSTATYSTAATGWALAVAVDGTAATDTTTRGMAIWEHPGDGTEGAAASTFTVTRATNTTGIGGVILIRVSNANTLQSIRMASGVGSTTITMTGRTAANADTLVLCAVTYATSGAGTWAATLPGVENLEVSSSPGTVEGAVGTDVVAAGASGDRTWTRGSSGASRGALLLINPTAGTAASGNGSLSLSGSGAASVSAAGSGSLSFGGSGTPGSQASGSAALALSGTGTAAAPTTGSGSLSLSASGTGTAAATGTATLSLAASGSATTPTSGSASLTLAATGSTATPAAASGSLTLSGAGSAAGATSSLGTLELIGTGALAAQALAEATLTLTAFGTASSSSPTSGTATLELSAAGHARVPMPTPAERTRNVLAENRTTATMAQDRTVVTYAEDRSVITHAEDRTEVEPARRAVLEPAENRTT